MHYLQLVRWPNLVLLFLLQYLLRYTMAGPILDAQNLGLLLTDGEFALLSISCVLIAAGGYVINDIEDVPIDRLNKPEKLIVSQSISRDQAYNLYLILTALGIIGGFYLTFVKQYKYIGYLNAISAGLLYFYSTSYKCIPLVGNLIVSLLSALAVFIVIIAEPFAREDEAVMLMIGVFMFFSFTTTLIREIIKDIEDIDGDLSCDCQTLANSLGMKKSKWLVVVLSILLTLTLLTAQYYSRQWESLLPFLYVTVFIDLPLILLIVQLMRSKDKHGFRKASNWLKLTMFTGVISLLVFYYSFN